MSNLIFPAWVPDHETLEYVLPRLFNPTMAPSDFVPSSDPDENPQQWMLGRYVDGVWRMNRHVRLSWAGNKGVIYPKLETPVEQEDGTIKKLGDTPIPGLHIDLQAIGKPLINALLTDPETGERMRQKDDEGNLLPIYARTCIRSLLGAMADVPVVAGVAEGIEGSSGMKLLNNLKIKSPRLGHQ